MKTELLSKPLVAFVIASLCVSCADENSGPAREPDPLLASVSYNSESFLPHYSGKDSLIYNDDNALVSFMQFDTGADEASDVFTYSIGVNGYLEIRLNGSDEVTYAEEIKSDSVRIRYYRQLSLESGTPTYVKFRNGKYKSLYERWEYTGDHVTFDMETEGHCVKRIEVFKDSKGNVTQVDSYNATTGSLQLVEKYMNFTYSGLKNPLKGYYLEPEYMRITYNKLPTAFEQSHELFDSYNRAVYNSAGEVIIDQDYACQYTVGKDGWVIGSKVSMNGSEFVDDITSITFSKKQ